MNTNSSLLNSTLKRAHRADIDFTEVIMNLTFLLCIIFACIAGIHATLDWSNLDVVNFQYFKYNNEQTTVKPFFLKRYGHLYMIRKIPDKPSKIEDTVNRAKAIFKYFKDLLVGRSGERVKSPNIINPESGMNRANQYQSKHGKFGERLVELLGSNPQREELIRNGLIDQ